MNYISFSISPYEILKIYQMRHVSTNKRKAVTNLNVLLD